LELYWPLGSYFAWPYIHEMSHILMAKARVGVIKYELKIFPHVDPVAGFAGIVVSVATAAFMFFGG